MLGVKALSSTLGLCPGGSQRSRETFRVTPCCSVLRPLGSHLVLGGTCFIGSLAKGILFISGSTLAGSFKCACPVPTAKQTACSGSVCPLVGGQLEGRGWVWFTPFPPEAPLGVSDVGRFSGGEADTEIDTPKWPLCVR